MAATRTIRHMQEFAPENESVKAYLERFQLFVAANAIDDDKLVPTLLTVVGSAHYSLIRGLVAPELPKNKMYDELVDLLKKHYDPEPIIIAERFISTSEARRPTNRSQTIWLTSVVWRAVATSAIFSQMPYGIGWYVG